MTDHQWGDGEVFVFGSNEAGRHGAGAARDALRHYGAVYGQGTGRQGNSYAIPTMDARIVPLSVARITEYVGTFLDYAREHSAECFFLTRIGCGLGGKADAEIAPLFASCPDNVRMPVGWRLSGGQ